MMQSHRDSRKMYYEALYAHERDTPSISSVSNAWYIKREEVKQMLKVY